MAGHRDDGTFAEDRAHHPNRKVGKPTHETWVTDRSGYDWLMGDSSEDDASRQLNYLMNSGWFNTGRVQPFGHNRDRYFSPSSPDFSGDTQYERATHPAYEGYGPFGDKKDK